MYLPERFRVDDNALLHDFIQRYSFATIITNAGGQTLISHAPVTLDRTVGAHGLLRAHIAAANPQVQHVSTGVEAIALFQGPHGYVSPRWYAGKLEVPTWNYTAVYAAGPLRELAGDGDKLALLQQLALDNEGPDGWTFDNNAQWIRAMLRHIVAFEIPIARLNGKFKLSQNKGTKDRDNVATLFAESANPSLRDLARYMRHVNSGGSD